MPLQYYINLSIYEVKVEAASRAVRRTDNEKLTVRSRLARHWLKPRVAVYVYISTKDTAIRISSLLTASITRIKSSVIYRCIFL
jgi:hypothetical protein